MKKEMIKIAIAQINTTVGDLKGNSFKIIDHIKRARRNNADIVVFPELAVCGYPPEDLLHKEHFIKDNLKALKSIVKNTEGITAVVGFVDAGPAGGAGSSKDIYNAAAIIRDKKLLGVYHKIELPNYGVFDEKRYFTPGAKNPTFKVKNQSFGVTICEDIWKDRGPYKEQAQSGARILINISASPYHAEKTKAKECMLSLRAKQTKAIVCYCNLVGGQDELVFDGASAVFNSKGRVIASAKQFEEDFVVFDTHAGGRISKRPGLIEEIYDALILGLRDYVKKNGFQKTVIGLSGGIDSALVAAMAVDALGKENVIGVGMPSRYSSHLTQSDARTLAYNLGIRFITVPIDSIFSIYLTVLEKEFFGLNRDTTEENLQARIRGNILMSFSNKFGWLVLTTGNKSETSTGYCTLYGDMAGGFAVIKDVPKTIVYELANYKNRKEGDFLIPKSIIKREPTAELRYNQKDKDSLPPYPVLDSILKEYIENDKSYRGIVAKGFNAAVVKKVMLMVDRNEYKRRQSPPGIKITPKAFGRDRRLPITSKYKEF